MSNDIAKAIIRFVSYAFITTLLFRYTQRVADNTFFTVTWIFVVFSAFLGWSLSKAGLNTIWLRGVFVTILIFVALPFTIYFASFRVSNDFILDRYFEDRNELQVVLTETDLVSFLMIELYEVGFDVHGNTRSFSQDVSENRDIFLDICRESEIIMQILYDFDMTPLSLYEYFNTRHYVYTKYDVHFLAFSVAVSILCLCLYLNYFEKKRRATLLLGVLIAVSMLLSIFGGGVLVYNFIGLRSDVYVSMESVRFVQEIASITSIAFVVFLSIDIIIQEYKKTSCQKQKNGTINYSH